jgi:hypothetical protein
MSIANIELVGPLPSAVHESIVFSAAIMAGAKNAEAAKALVNFLRFPAHAGGCGSDHGERLAAELKHVGRFTFSVM